MEQNQSESRQETNKLYRSKANRVIGGVCGGIAEYFNIDPILIRIAWVFVTLFAGAGIIAYIVALIIVPDNPVQESVSSSKKNSGDFSKLLGSLLIVAGGVILLKQMGVFYNFHWWAIPWQGLFAVLLVGSGVYLIYYQKNRTEEEKTEAYHDQPSANRLYRISENKMLAGVCTGFAAYFDIDVTLIRLLWVFATLASGGLGIVAYIIAIIAFPEAKTISSVNQHGGKQ